MAVKAVIALVGADHRHRVPDLCQRAEHFRAVMIWLLGGQAVGQDLTRRGVHCQMQLAPHARFCLAMLAHLPFPLAKALEPGRVDGQMRRPVALSTRNMLGPPA